MIYIVLVISVCAILVVVYACTRYLEDEMYAQESRRFEAYKEATGEYARTSAKFMAEIVELSGKMEAAYMGICALKQDAEYSHKKSGEILREVKDMKEGIEKDITRLMELIVVKGRYPNGSHTTAPSEAWLKQAWPVYKPPGGEVNLRSNVYEATFKAQADIPKGSDRYETGKSQIKFALENVPKQKLAIEDFFRLATKKSTGNKAGPKEILDFVRQNLLEPTAESINTPGGYRAAFFGKDGDESLRMFVSGYLAEGEEPRSRIVATIGIMDKNGPTVKFKESIVLDISPLVGRYDMPLQPGGIKNSGEFRRIRREVTAVVEVLYLRINPSADPLKPMKYPEIF